MLTHLDDDGDQRILLTDFGIAHDVNDNGAATTSNMTVGTVAYCAPEQLRGEEVGGPADQYALAATAYRLLSGTPLFSNTDPEVVIDHQLHTPPPALAATRPELAALDPVLAVALAKRPEERFARCSDFARALNEQVQTMHAQPPYVATDVVDTAPVGIVSPPRYHPAPVEPSIADRVTASFSVDPRAMHVRHKRSPVAPILFGVGALLVVALAAWLFWPSDGSDSSGQSTASSTAPPVDSAAQNRLSGLLPAGYPADSCKPAESPKGVQAKVSCTANSDAGGPRSAAYTLATDKAALQSAFDGIVSSSTMVNCPGNIQSPGPWRRNATPQLVSGTLFCGFRASIPIVVWTDDANLVLSSVEGARDHPNLDELYVWWTSHS
jgi:serine/threonine-protein kinase